MTYTHFLDLSTLRISPVKKQPARYRVWMYQHPGEQPQELVKEGKWWYYNAPKANGGGSVGADSLRDAKGDLEYYGAKVWSELR